MNHRHIFFVPGKNPKPPADQHSNLLWSTLLEGIKRASPEIVDEVSQYPEAFKLIAWNYLYYHEHKDVSRELLWIDKLLNQHGPTEQDIKEANAWHQKVDRVSYTIIDHAPFMLKLLTGSLRATAEETQRYFQNDDNIARDVRECLKKELRPLLKNHDEDPHDENSVETPERVLLIAHSLGSVIAYDTLWELSHQEHLNGEIDLLTIGSPLGMNYVQHRLMGNSEEGREKYPDNIHRWINISSIGDVTALDRSFADDFSEMLEFGMVESIEDHCEGIYNFYRNEEGLNCHRSYGYLVNTAVGKVIADWWKL